MRISASVPWCCWILPLHSPSLLKFYMFSRQTVHTENVSRRSLPRTPEAIYPLARLTFDLHNKHSCVQQTIASTVDKNKVGNGAQRGWGPRFRALSSPVWEAQCGTPPGLSVALGMWSGTCKRREPFLALWKLPLHGSACEPCAGSVSACLTGKHWLSI